jgi:hypothetical protein
MTRTNDIDRFAEQAGFPARRAFSDLSDLYPRLERFAALVLANHPPQSSMAWQEGYEAGASAERNKLAQWMIDRSYATGHGDTTEDLLDELDWQITESWSKVVMASVESERDAVCRIVTGLCISDNNAEEINRAIRARGQV